MKSFLSFFIGLMYAANAFAALPNPLYSNHTPVVSSNTALTAMKVSSGIPSVVRLGFATKGDSPPVTYNPQVAPCSLNAGAGDGGSQVQSVDGGCWLGQISSANADVRIWGAKGDGTTDALSALNACIAAFDNACLIPPTSRLFRASGTVLAPNGLRGVVAKMGNGSADNSGFNGSSGIVCDTAVTPCLQVGSSSVNANSQTLSNIVVTRNGTPPAGAVGILVSGGYRAQFNNVKIFNSDTCLKLYAFSTTGITFSGFNVNSGWCTTYAHVIDGWPEAHFYGSRLGDNGSGNPTAMDSVIYLTNSNCSAGGCGPNTLTYDGAYISAGGGGGTACGVKWGGFSVPATNVQGGTVNFSNSFFEWHAYSGASPKKGVICSDSTIGLMNDFHMSNNTTATGGVTVPLFDLDPLTALLSWKISGNTFGCSGITLAPVPAGGVPGFRSVVFDGNQGCSSFSVAPGNSGNQLTSFGNTWGTFNVSGGWNNLTSTGDLYTAINDTATGNVALTTNAIRSSWTPVLTFGGASVGVTYSVQTGSWARTAGGGFIGFFNIALTSKGTSTGAVSITGFPLRCASGFTQTVINGASLSGMGTSPVIIAPSGVSAAVIPSLAGNNGLAQMTDVNFSNATNLLGTVQCGLAQ